MRILKKVERNRAKTYGDTGASKSRQNNTPSYVLANLFLEHIFLEKIVGLPYGLARPLTFVIQTFK